jgi:hypothetical protein
MDPTVLRQQSLSCTEFPQADIPVVGEFFTRLSASDSVRHGAAAIGVRQSLMARVLHLALAARSQARVHAMFIEVVLESSHLFPEHSRTRRLAR